MEEGMDCLPLNGEGGQDGGACSGYVWALAIFRELEALRDAGKRYEEAYRTCFWLVHDAAKALRPGEYSEKGWRLSRAQAGLWLELLQVWSDNFGEDADRLARSLAEDWARENLAGEGRDVLSALLPRMDAEGPSQ